MHDLLSIGRHLLGVSLLRSLQSHLCSALTVQNITENNYVILHEQNTTAFQLNVFLTGIHPLPATNNGRSAFPSTNNCQGQLQTSQSISVLFLCSFIHLQPPLTYVNMLLALVGSKNYFLYRTTSLLQTISTLSLISYSVSSVFSVLQEFTLNRL